MRKPARSLFRDVRMYFPMDRQLRVYTVIACHVDLAISIWRKTAPLSAA